MAIQTILEEIERDLRAFADPGSEVFVDKDGAFWEQHGAEMSVRFSAVSGQPLPDIAFNEVHMPFRDFLASGHMADLPRLADFIVKTGGLRKDFIDTSADAGGEEPGESRKGSATDLVRALTTENLPYLSTEVVLVRGDAGSGKTIALRELTRRQADDYLGGRTKSLFFYVDAQGRALSRLEDAMAKDLHDLRSRFSYTAIAPLARHGLIIPIIDGFDELLGSGGYDEAFSSLAAFLATLRGEGAVVASARSAFFYYRNFYENAARFSGDGSLNYRVDTVNIRPWDDDQVLTYFRQFGDAYKNRGEELVERYREVKSHLSEEQQDLLKKPFYASRLAQLMAEGMELASGDDLLDQLVDAFLKREAQKLLDKEGRPLLNLKGHLTFLTGLAEEMWWQESRRVDVGTIQAIAELTAESFGLPPGALRAIVEKVSSYAFLASDASERKLLRFEHEVFYGYFLAQNLQQIIERDPEDLRRFLGRAVLDETLVERTVRLLGSDRGRCSRAAESISSSLRSGFSEVVSRENGGVLVASLIRASGGLRAGMTLRNLIFRQVSFGEAELVDTVFDKCDLSEVDLTRTRLTRPRFVDTPLRDLIVDPDRTRLEGAELQAGEQVHGLIVRSGRKGIRTGRIYAPGEIGEVLSLLGVKANGDSVRGTRVYSAKLKERIDVLDRFVRRMERRYYVAEDDPQVSAVFRAREWKDIKRQLDDCGLIEEQLIQKSGPRQPLIRLTVPPDVLRSGENTADMSVPDNVRRFWRRFLEE